ncbi:putative uncharacterized protein DDB_G0271606 [Pollicipes pollicipes]|uniref:putative uncharacterized protein DDB_G0271606 n=1 Tax=Pollicipes pollicipes TaxID=41117 RepID=UPI0018854DD3|nr:putative uncharacterized protein DDB_G0271606 [Pollicipes pollicipes]
MWLERRLRLPPAARVAIQRCLVLLKVSRIDLGWRARQMCELPTLREGERYEDALDVESPPLREGEYRQDCLLDEEFPVAREEFCQYPLEEDLPSCSGEVRWWHSLDDEDADVTDLRPSDLAELDRGELEQLCCQMQRTHRQLMRAHELMQAQPRRASRAELEDELLASQTLVRDLEAALLRRGVQPTTLHEKSLLTEQNLWLSRRLRQLRAAEASARNELQELRDQNELMEFRILELESDGDKTGGSTEQPEGAGVTAGQDIVSAQILNENMVASSEPQTLEAVSEDRRHAVAAAGPAEPALPQQQPAAAREPDLARPADQPQQRKQQKTTSVPDTASQQQQKQQTQQHERQQQQVDLNTERHEWQQKMASLQSTVLELEAALETARARPPPSPRGPDSVRVRPGSDAVDKAIQTEPPAAEPVDGATQTDGTQGAEGELQELTESAAVRVRIGVVSSGHATPCDMKKVFSNIFGGKKEKDKDKNELVKWALV